ncbi:hypothetical protein D3C87_1536020 [compost metagenome]
MQLRRKNQVLLVGLAQLVVDVQDFLVELHGCLMILVHLAFHADWSRRIAVGVVVMHHHVNYTGPRSHVRQTIVHVVHFLQRTHRHLHRS